MSTKVKQQAERALWTFVAAFISAMLAPSLADAIAAVTPVTITFSLDAIEAAFVAGVAALGQYVLDVARWRLSVLPSPGELTRTPPADDNYTPLP